MGRYKKTRIAPTPSGYLHIGNVLSFVITTGIARREGAKVLLRIDDMDRDRLDLRYVQDIFDTLNFLEIGWDEGPRNLEEYERTYSQVHRMEQYGRMLQQLADSGAVFACTCSRAQLHNGVYTGTCLNRHLPLDTSDACWRLRTAAGKPVQVLQLRGAPARAALSDTMQYFVVRKKDGYPAYQLTSVADDLHYGVDLVVRGEDLWDSTVAQLYLADVADAAQFKDVTFYHHPLLKTQAGEKLSKSAGATSIQYLRKEGLTKEDIYALLAREAGLETAGSLAELTEKLLKALLPA